VPDNWYDTVVAADVLEHLTKPDLVLRALRNKLRRPGAGEAAALAWPHPLVVVSVPNLGFWPESLSKLLDGSWDYEDHGVRVHRCLWESRVVP
jgi:hypothetical protein